MYLQKTDRIKPLFLLFALAVVLLLLVFTAMTTATSTATSNPYSYLSQFEGRLVPNERPPRDEFVAAQAAGFELDGSAASLQRLNKWYAEFYTANEKSGPNPIAYAERMADLREAEARGLSPQAIGGGEVGTAKMLMIPFEFAGSDDIPVCESDLETSTGMTLTVEGPRRGTIPNPAADGDNNTIWTDIFSDTSPAAAAESIEWYEDLIFGNGPSPTFTVRADLDGGVDLAGVSARNWYQEQSEGMYDIVGEIYSTWITLPHSVAYYGWDGNELDPGGNGYPCGGNQSGFGFEFVIDVVNQLNVIDPGFDWSEYDVDGDGIVDHLMVIHAGVDNSAGGGEYGNFQLWAHSWDVYCDQDGDDELDYGCVVDDGGTPEDPDDDILVANYTHIPEDADIGVVVHEYGHDIGLPDYYITSGSGTNSTAHWINMASGSWSGKLGGSHPAPFNPWGRYFFGWASPMNLSYDTAPISVTIGQSAPTPTGTQDFVWIDLPDQEVTVDNRAGEGKGLHAILGNQLSSPLQQEFDLSSASAPMLTFNTYFDIETDWDYTYVRASTDGGSNWTILFNEEGVYATSNPNGSGAWMGEGGLTDQYEGVLTYDLSDYAGESSVMLQFLYVTDAAVQESGIWLDDISIDDGTTNLYSSDLEDTSDWTISGWEEVPYDESFAHYYLLEWRNNEGSIASVGHDYQYQSLIHDQTGWMVDKFAANTPGLLVWYRNEFYENNNITSGGRYFDPPATGPKGELLVVDSHHEPIPWSIGLWDPISKTLQPRMSNRRAAMDAAFTLDDTPDWMIHDQATISETVMNFGGRPAVSLFRDSQRTVPGWLFPGDGLVYRIAQDHSVVIPGSGDYSTRIRALDDSGVNPGDDLMAFWGFTVSGQALGSGHPGDAGAHYGLNIELVEQGVDGTWGRVNIWNSQYRTEESGDYGARSSEELGEYALLGESGTATFTITNTDSPLSNTILIAEIPSNLAYVSGTLSSDWVGISGADASDPWAAAEYVADQGFSNLQGQPEPGGVLFFAFALEDAMWAMGAPAPDLSYDYVAVASGMPTTRYYVFHEDGEYLPGLRVFPALDVWSAYYMPIIATGP